MFSTGSSTPDPFAVSPAGVADPPAVSGYKGSRGLEQRGTRPFAASLYRVHQGPSRGARARPLLACLEALPVPRLAAICAKLAALLGRAMFAINGELLRVAA